MNKAIKNGKILLIEDEKISQIVTAENIRECGFEVDISASGDETIKLLTKSKKDYLLVFMDLGLPDTDGFKLTQEIRQSGLINKDIPILALTAHNGEKYKEKAIQYGLNDFLVKPMTEAKTRKTLKKFKLLA